MKCVLCGTERLEREVTQLHTRDFRGQAIVVPICVDSRACIDRATARVPQSTAQKRRALGAK